MSSWNKFCDLNKIAPSLQNVTLAVSEYMPKERRDLGIKWIKNPLKSLMLTGDNGLGKTYFIHCLIRGLLILCPDLSQIRFFKSKYLDDRLYDDLMRFGSSSDILTQLKEIPFLFLDDLGVERNTERVERDIYEIIDCRVEWKRPTIISTNMSNKEIQGAYGKRILSRLKESVWIQFTGNDLRGTL